MNYMFFATEEKNETNTLSEEHVWYANNTTGGRPHGHIEIKQYDDGQPHRCLDVSTTLLHVPVFLNFQGVHESIRQSK